MAQSNNSKLIFAVVLLVIATGIFAYHFSTQKKPKPIGPSSEFKTEANQALEEALGVATSKGWKDVNTWENANAAQFSSKNAEVIFGNSPSAGDVKVLACGPDGEDRAAILMDLQVGNNKKCISVSLIKNKSGKYVFRSVIQSSINVKDYKTYN